jgi:diguanylate cyclase (GGDEF)-like protein
MVRDAHWSGRHGRRYPAAIVDTAAPPQIALLERQLQAGVGLEFLPELEAPYLSERADVIVVRRLWLVAVAVLLIGITPALNAFLLHPPDAFNRHALAAQFGLMIPALLVAALFTGVRRLRRWQDPVAMVVAFAVVAGLLYQRRVGAAVGFAVPIELVSVVLLGTAVLGGLRLVWFLPAVVAIVTAFAANEVKTFGANPSALNTIVAMTMMAILAVIGSYLEERNARREWLQRRLAEQRAVRDSLTGLPNARSFRETWPQLHAIALREGRPLLVAVLDIDYFKNYNDRYGHLAGDECLRRVAQVLPRHGRRATDLQARTGGEEFVLAWYDVELEQAPALLEALRADVERLGLRHAARPSGPGVVTISIGGACLAPGAGGTPEALLEAADRQLYAAKKQGRNRVALG